MVPKQNARNIYHKQMNYGVVSKYVPDCSEQVNCSGPPLSARERCMAKMIISMCLCYLATNLPVSAIKLSRGNDSNDIPNIRLFFSFLFWSQYRYTQFGL